MGEDSDSHVKIYKIFKMKCWIQFISLVLSSPLSPLNHKYNLNQAERESNPLFYKSGWQKSNYFPSPESWRFPFYTLFLDRWSDGDPRNNNINDTLYEFDPYQTNFRHGGDVIGLLNQLDYLQNLGIKGIYIAGTPFLNLPWDFHGYNPLDFTLLDPHLGTVDEWRLMVQKVHERGMYLIIDLTVVTLGDLLTAEGYSTVTYRVDL